MKSVMGTEKKKKKEAREGEALRAASGGGWQSNERPYRRRLLFIPWISKVPLKEFSNLEWALRKERPEPCEKNIAIINGDYGEKDNAKKGSSKKKLYVDFDLD